MTIMSGMAQPVPFDSFEEWADHVGLTEAQRAEQARVGATIGQRFDTEDMRRQFDERMAARAVRATKQARDLAAGASDTGVVDLLAGLEASVMEARQLPAWQRSIKAAKRAKKKTARLARATARRARQEQVAGSKRPAGEREAQ